MDQKTKYKLLALAILTAARGFIRGQMAQAVFDMLEEDILMNWDTIFANSQKKKAFLAAIKKVAKSGEGDPFASLWRCLEELETSGESGEEE